MPLRFFYFFVFSPFSFLSLPPVSKSLLFYFIYILTQIVWASFQAVGNIRSTKQRTMCFYYVATVVSFRSNTPLCKRIFYMPLYSLFFDKYVLKLLRWSYMFHCSQAYTALFEKNYSYSIAQTFKMLAYILQKSIF